MNYTKGKYPNTFYRVSIKAIIRDTNGHVLMVKEGSDIWGLPGGGIDHGETAHEALRRELYEEADITQVFEAQIVGVDARFLTSRQAYLMWVIYDVTFSEQLRYEVGHDAQAVEFVDPRRLKDSRAINERMIYRWTIDRAYDIYALGEDH